jgi:hypothetical protein
VVLIVWMIDSIATTTPEVLDVCARIALSEPSCNGYEGETGQLRSEKVNGSELNWRQVENTAPGTRSGISAQLTYPCQARLRKSHLLSKVDASRQLNLLVI